MDQERQHTHSAAVGGSATAAVDYRTLSTAELTEIRFAKLDDWLDDGHVSGEVRANILGFVDAIADRAGYDWSSGSGTVDDGPT